MMIHPPMLYTGYVGFSIPFAFAIGALIAPHRCGLDPRDASRPRRLDVPRHRDPAGRALVVLGARLGRLLGLGPGRERVADALARGHRVPALDHGAGEARHAEGLERVAHLRDVRARSARHVPRAQRHPRVDPRVRASTIGVQFLVFISAVLILSATLIIASCRTCARVRGSTRCCRARRSSCSTTSCSSRWRS